jgi:hypothetical protein
MEAKGGHNGGAVREPPLRCPPRATGPHGANGLGPIRTVKDKDHQLFGKHPPQEPIIIRPCNTRPGIGRPAPGSLGAKTARTKRPAPASYCTFSTG